LKRTGGGKRTEEGKKDREWGGMVRVWEGKKKKGTRTKIRGS